MTRIVTYAHRYKRPSRKRKTVALEVPVVTPPKLKAPATPSPAEIVKPGKGRAGNDTRATIVETKPRKGSKGGGWADDGSPSDPEMRAVILRMMQGRPRG